MPCGPVLVLIVHLLPNMKKKPENMNKPAPKKNATPKEKFYALTPDKREQVAQMVLSSTLAPVGKYRVKGEGDRRYVFSDDPADPYWSFGALADVQEVATSYQNQSPPKPVNIPGANPVDVGQTAVNSPAPSKFQPPPHPSNQAEVSFEVSAPQQRKMTAVAVVLAGTVVLFMLSFVFHHAGGTQPENVSASSTPSDSPTAVVSDGLETLSIPPETISNPEKLEVGKQNISSITTADEYPTKAGGNEVSVEPETLAAQILRQETAQQANVSERGAVVLAATVSQIPPAPPSTDNWVVLAPGWKAPETISGLWRSISSSFQASAVRVCVTEKGRLETISGSLRGWSEYGEVLPQTLPETWKANWQAHYTTFFDNDLRALGEIIPSNEFAAVTGVNWFRGVDGGEELVLKSSSPQRLWVAISVLVYGRWRPAVEVCDEKHWTVFRRGSEVVLTSTAAIKKIERINRSPLEAASR